MPHSKSKHSYFHIVEFLSYVNLHFHFTLMQKFKFWYQLEGNSIRNNFGSSVQRSFQLGGQGAPPGGATHRTYGNRCISWTDNASGTHISSKDA